MSCYVDTSALVATIVREAHTPRVRLWLREQAPGSVFISDWCHTELASALSLKVRIGEIDLDQRALALAAWQHLHPISLPTLAVTPDHFDTAATMANRHDLGLRAGDALHLAIAQGGGHMLVTLDKRMANAAPQLGIPVEAV